jgi:hypothetical protein
MEFGELEYWMKAVAAYYDALERVDGGNER